MADAWKVITAPTVEPVTLAEARLHLRVGTPGLTASAITKANPGSVTANSHGLADGQTVTWTATTGMTELDGVLVTVTVLNADAFTIGLNTTAYATADGSESYWPDDPDDTQIESLIEGVRENVERDAARALVTQTIEFQLDAFPAGDIELPAPPLQSVTSIKYNDGDGDEQTVSTDDYVVDTTSEPGRIGLAIDASWPSTRGELGDVTITFKAGYGDAASDVPRKAVQAILLGLSLEYEQYDDKIAEQLTKAYRAQIERIGILSYA